jgi:hypothetical protein
MSAAWAAVIIAGLANGAGLLTLAWRTGRWTGTVTAALGELRRIATDHETRIRALTGGRRHG